MDAFIYEFHGLTRDDRMDFEVLKKLAERNRIAYDLERKGEVDEAIDLYEKNLEENYEIAYYRLAIIYRKRKQFTEEIRVLKKGIWIYENIVYEGRTDRISKLKKIYERLNKAEKLKGTPVTSYKLPEPTEIVMPGTTKPSKPVVPRVNTKTISGKALYLQSLEPQERRNTIYNMPLDTKVSIIRKAVKQECSSLKVGYHKPFGSYGEKFLAIMPTGHNWNSFSDNEKIAIVRLFGDIIGIHNPSSVPMALVDITNIDAFVERSVQLIY